MSGSINIEIEDSIATLTISRPDKLNSVTKEMLVSFDENIEQLINDPNIFGIILTGEGERAFSAGFDMDTVLGLEGEEHHDFFKLLEGTARKLRKARVITLVAARGYVIGFGAIIACASDFRFFADDVVFRLPEVDLTIFPGAGATSNLIHLVGPAKAKDILLTGRKVSANECKEIGIADRVYPADDVLPIASEFMAELSKKDRKLVFRTKSLVDLITGTDMSEADEHESVYLDEWLRDCSDCN